MPLASNASVSLKAIPKPNNTKQQKSQPPFASDTANISSSRSSSTTGSSNTTTTTTNNNKKNRLSLPKSLPSSTIVTKSKVERRRSLLRLAAAEAAKENTTTPNKKRRHNNNNDEMDNDNVEGYIYSPPETRSASKLQKKLKIAPLERNSNFFHESNRQNALLQFSPPDHQLNQQREQQQLQWKEEQRSRRIAEARRNGQLLMIPSDANECNVDGDDPDSSNLVVEDVSNAKNTTDTVITTDDKVSKKIDEDLIKKMSDEVSRLAQYQIEAKNERRNSDAHLLQMVQEIMTKEQEKASSEQSLTVLQSTTKVLEQTNVKLMEEMKLLNTQFIHETESHTTHTTQLEMKLQQAQEKITVLEALQIKLTNQISTLESEMTNAKSSYELLQQELNQTRIKLDRTQKEMMVIEQAMDHDNVEYSNKMKELQRTNDELQSMVETQKQSYTQLQHVLQSKEVAIQQMQSEMIPNLQATLELERDQVARLEQALELRQHDFDLANDDINRLQKEIQTLQDQYHEIHQNSISMEGDHKQMVQEIEKSRLEMEMKLHTTKDQLSLEIQQLTETKLTLQNSNDSFVVQQKQLNDALEESMSQLDQTEKEKRTIQHKLQQALQQIDTIQKSLSLSNTETSEMIQQLTEQVHTERKLRDETEQIRNELDTIVRSQKNEIVTLQQQVQVTTQERDIARNNMDGYNVREQKLYDQLQYYEHVRREMHSKLMQLMGNIRVFVRIRPKLPHEEEEEVDCNNTRNDDNVATKKKPRLSMHEKPQRRENIGNDNEEIFRYPGMYNSGNNTKVGTSSGDRNIIKHPTSGGDTTSHTSSTSSTDATKNMIEVTAPYKDRGGLNDRRKQWTFGFDQVFTPFHTQNDIWDATDPLIQCAVDGYHVTIFAYGQTGSGKTFTMLGEEGINEGIICRTVRKLFDEKQKIIDLSRGESSITIFVELLEIYNEKVRDLLSTGKDELKLTSNEVVGNILAETNTVDEVLQVLKLAQGRRCVKATNSNSESSRSHMIFTIHFKVTMNDGNTIRNGKVNICDLAGSERLDKSGANIVGGTLLEETKNINKSLSVLSNVIERLQAGESKNVPFRESKLTYLLKDSLSGNSKTLAIICCNPLASHINESLCSLRFAEKVNRVDLKAVANFSC